jgi:hypothetical protein
VTTGVLREVGMELVSDGFAGGPFRKEGLVWIPQQLWGPVEKSSGLWTICLHANSATEEEIGALECFLRRFAAQFTSVDRVLSEWPIAERSLSDWLFHERMLSGIRLKKIRRRLRIA